MRRTKETFHKEQPHFSEREGVSGLKDFDGEDLGTICFEPSINAFRIRLKNSVYEDSTKGLD